MYENIKALKLEKRGKILIITIDSPPANPVTPEMHTELSTIFGQINRDPDVAVVVITGAGDKTFSAGGNIKTMADRAEKRDTKSYIPGFVEAKQIVFGMLQLERPLIGRINGHAMGLGATIAVCCDLTYVVEDAKIADTHVNVGIAAGDGGALMWPVLMGYHRAKEYLLTGDVMTGKRAVELGLMSYAMPRAELDETVFAMAERLASGASQAINYTKKAINLLLLKQFETLMEQHLALEMFSFHSEDHREAATAYRDKRAPKFSGN